MKTLKCAGKGRTAATLFLILSFVTGGTAYLLRSDERSSAKGAVSGQPPDGPGQAGPSYPPYPAVVGPIPKPIPLIARARVGDAAAVRALLHRGADLEARDEYGASALMRAAQVGSSETVRLLLQCGADVAARDREGKPRSSGRCGTGAMRKWPHCSFGLGLMRMPVPWRAGPP